MKRNNRDEFANGCKNCGVSNIVNIFEYLCAHPQKAAYAPILGAGKGAKERQLEPVGDIQMFRDALGASDGNAAYMVTYGNDISCMCMGLSLLEYSEDSASVCNLLMEHMPDSVKYDVFLHSLSGDTVPDWLQMKVLLLDRLQSLVHPDQCVALLTGNNLFETLYEEVKKGN